jgi:hypothetical protein
MKAYSLFTAAMAALLFTSCADGDKAEDIAPGDVPPAVVTSLSNKYPGAAEVKWEKDNHDGKIVYEADFLYEGKKMDAEFDEAGTLLEE